MSDLIDRQQAIDACMKYNGYGSVWACIMGDIKQLPSVTIKDTADKIKVTKCNHIAEDSKKVSISWPHENDKDVIYRQDAIDALFELYEYQRDIDPTEAADLVRQGIFLAEKKIEKLPSAQPDYTMRCNYCDMSICTLEDKPCSRRVVRENG